MTRHQRPEFSKKILLENIKLLNKKEISKLIAESFTKEDMMKSIDFIYSQANMNTNDKLEKYFHKWIVKSHTVENTL
jgi:hypothetical protein